MTSPRLFIVIVALIILILALIGITIARSVGAITFDAIFHHLGNAVDRAGVSEWILVCLFLLFGLMLFSIGAYAASKWRWLFRFIAGTSLHPSSLCVTFSRHVSGCKVTTYKGDSQTIYYRLWVRPGTSGGNQNCVGTLIDIMAPTKGMPGHWHPIWEPERLRLCWATHTKAPETRIDLKGDEGQFLDVFFMTEAGEFGFGCEVHPASLDNMSFEVGATYMLVISLSCDGEEAQKVRLKLEWPKDWQDESIELIQWS